MQEVFQELAVLLVILCAGAYFGKKGILNEGCISQMNKMVVKIAFPALVIASMDKDFTPELLQNSIGLVVISGACFSAVILFWRSGNISLNGRRKN